ncbi:aminotransferase class I/II-fold pyridoxal phosphate-dependent enzyme [Sphaerothrix gracilis]|uniref:aminotransferase class I/II-fold pyridoxal phosphate-dependent enzyme n=1 Tax=Sphaerothrix gracilis TaxID=3151835 RepID=UPI0031FCB78C
MTIAELLSLEPDAAQQFNQTWLGYTETQGSLELREAIAQTYQSVGIEQILVHAGAEEAIFIARFQVCLLRSNSS